MKIRIVCVGKIKESFYRDAIAEYVKRMSKWCKCEIVETAEEPLAGNSDKQIAATVHAEGARLSDKCKGRVVALDRGGEMWTSEQLAEQIRAIQ